MKFKDKLSLSKGDKNNRTVVSIRDGVQEYLGVELGMTPPDKMFTLYRSPETIRGLVDGLIGIPLADGHIDEEIVPEAKKKGKILTSIAKDFVDEATYSTVFVENGIHLADNMIQLVQEGKDELSLDYTANLIPHEKHDFEQVEIVPKFLAIVEAGRCGKQCNFKDKKGENRMEEILKMIKDLSPEDKLALMSKLAPVKKDTEDADDKEEIKKDLEDAKEEGVKEGAEKFKDSKCFKDTMTAYADDRTELVTKASKYLSSDYTYKGKTNDTIMRDTLNAERAGVSFKDSEIGVAFKMLQDNKATDEHKDFADSEKESVWTKLEKGDS